MNGPFEADNKRAAFPVYFSFGRMIQRLTDQQAGRLFKAMLVYAERHQAPDLDDDPTLAMLFDNFEALDDENYCKWKLKKEKARQSALARWNAKQNADPPDQSTLGPET